MTRALSFLLAAFLVGGELPGVRLCGRARAWGAGVSVRSGTRLGASRIVGIAEIAESRVSGDSVSRSRGRRTSSSAMTSSAGAASAFDLVARGILKGGCDFCVRTRRATGCGSRRPVVHVSERARDFTSLFRDA